MIKKVKIVDYNKNELRLNVYFFGLLVYSRITITK